MEQYWLRVGTTGAGSFDVYSNTQGTNTSKTVSGLPTGGETLYVRLFSMVNGGWLYNDYTYTACDFASQTATIQTSSPGTAFDSAISILN